VRIPIHPLRQELLTPAVGALRETLDDKGLRTEPGRMSTYVVGEDQVAFAALQDAFGRATAWDMW
jgi:hypothetical protein